MTCNILCHFRPNFLLIIRLIDLHLIISTTVMLYKFPSGQQLTWLKCLFWNSSFCRNFFGKIPVPAGIPAWCWNPVLHRTGLVSENSGSGTTGTGFVITNSGSSWKNRNEVGKNPVPASLCISWKNRVKSAVSKVTALFSLFYKIKKLVWWNNLLFNLSGIAYLYKLLNMTD